VPLKMSMKQINSLGTIAATAFLALFIEYVALFV